MLPPPYGNKTLTANWFEDRWQPQEVADKPRQVRPYESEIPAGSMRRVVQRETWALPDDGFPRVQESKTQVDYPHPRSHVEVVFNPPKDPHYISSETIPEVCHSDRRPMNDIPGTGFRAVLCRHPDNVNAREYTTAARDANGNRVTKKLELGHIPAGIAGKPAKPEMIALVGENVGLCNIPVQRSWMNDVDPGLREFEKAGGVHLPLPAKDNELSIPIGDGAMKKIQADLKARGGWLYKQKTSITSGKARKNEVSIWDDYP